MISAIKDVKEHNEGVKSQIKEIKEDINKLGNDGFNVEVKLDELEQYARRDCLEITGIPVVPNDSPAVHSKRDEIYSKRKNLKSKWTKDLPSVVCEPESAVVSHKVQIHVNESLTPYRKRLLGAFICKAWRADVSLLAPA